MLEAGDVRRAPGSCAWLSFRPFLGLAAFLLGAL